MASFPLQMSKWCRHALTVAAALAMLPPLYAGASFCHSNGESCPHCAGSAAKNESNHTFKHDCCHDKRQASEHAAAVQSIGPGNDSSSCTCDALPTHQPMPSATRNVPNSPDFVVLSNSVSFDAVCHEPTRINTTAWLTYLSPAIPHRILHCTWLI